MFEDGYESTDDERSTKLSLDYLNRAREAQELGDDSLATSLYLAAFDCACKEEQGPAESFLEGLKQAWFLAATQKRRTLAEHIFELMVPYLSHDEVERYALRLQDLALDRLEEFGVSRSDLAGMLEALPQEIREFKAMSEGAMLASPGDFAGQAFPFFGFDFSALLPSVQEVEEMVEEAAEAYERPYNAEDGGAGSAGEEEASEEDSLCDCADPVDHVGKEMAIEPLKAADQAIPGPQPPRIPNAMPGIMPFFSPMLQGANGALAAFGLSPTSPKAAADERLTYADMAGFERAIARMQAFGIGIGNDPELREFVALLNKKHGLPGMPVADSLLFRSPAREDAGHFMDATLGELGIPGVRIRVDENGQGNLVLCVFAQTHAGLRLNAGKNEIEGSGVLLLEDIDLWSHLLVGDEDNREYGTASRVSKGAREAMRLIRSAVENPDVYVLASCSSELDPDDLFLDILEPLSIIDIDYPTEAERISLWNDLMNRHSSLNEADLDTLVAFSRNLPRFDIYMAAREAVESSYKESLASRVYKPVSTALLCQKLASYQPLESEEYKHLEDQVVKDFRQELEDLDSLLGFGSAHNVADLLGEDLDGLEPTEPAAE